MDMSEKFKIAVIGGGPAGYVAAIKASMLGANVVLFERRELGGTCLNRGCVPTKSYLKTAEIIMHIREGKKRGIINDPAASVDLEKMIEHKNTVIKTLTGGVESLLRSHGVTVVRGEAVLESPNVVRCSDVGYNVEKVLLCGGSLPVCLPIPGSDLNDVITSDQIMELTKLPVRLCIIGGGVIGCEMAVAFAAFGSKVTIIEAANRLIPAMDEELSNLMFQSIKKQGITILTGRQATNIVQTELGIEVTVQEEQYYFDKILVSAGRKPDLSCLGDIKNNIIVDRGYVNVSDYMETSVSGIYAPGDINGISMLAHAAFKMGETSAENAVLGNLHKCDLNLVPSCIYTIPEAAAVGITEKEAVENYGRSEVITGRFPFNANGRALASGENTGMVKVIADAKYGELLGVHMFGYGVTELIAGAAALMDQQITVHEISKIIHPHPSYSEAFMEACADAIGMAVHLPKR